MKFTEADKQVLAKVRRRYRLWLRFRGAFLAIYALGMVISLAVFIALGLAEVGAVADPERSSSLKVVAIVALWAPFALAICFSCAIGLGTVIGRWNAPSRELLLRLAEEHEDKN
jgi:hypothetical protein